MVSTANDHRRSRQSDRPTSPTWTDGGGRSSIVSGCDVEQTTEVVSWRGDATRQTIVGQHVDELDGWRIGGSLPGSLQVDVEIADNEQRLDECSKTVENVG